MGKPVYRSEADESGTPTHYACPQVPWRRRARVLHSASRLGYIVEISTASITAADLAAQPASATPATPHATRNVRHHMIELPLLLPQQIPPRRRVKLGRFLYNRHVLCHESYRAARSRRRYNLIPVGGGSYMR